MRGDERSFPVQRVGSRARLALEEVTRDARRSTADLWGLQQAVFRARMDALVLMIKEGLQPVSEARVAIDIRVEYRAVPDSAGDVGLIPDQQAAVRSFAYDADWVRGP